MGDGRMLDVYQRLKGEEKMFFVPDDSEISNHELGYIIRKAEQWRGTRGERRKTAVYDYVWETEDFDDSEDNDVSSPSEYTREITTHISIHTLHLDGMRELFRHFLRQPDGSILEVFGDVGNLSIEDTIKSALEQSHASINASAAELDSGTNGDGTLDVARGTLKKQASTLSTLSFLDDDMLGSSSDEGQATELSDSLAAGLRGGRNSIAPGVARNVRKSKLLTTTEGTSSRRASSMSARLSFGGLEAPKSAVGSESKRGRPSNANLDFTFDEEDEEEIFISDEPEAASSDSQA